MTELNKFSVVIEINKASFFATKILTKRILQLLSKSETEEFEKIRKDEINKERRKSRTVKTDEVFNVATETAMFKFLKSKKFVKNMIPELEPLLAGYFQIIARNLSNEIADFGKKENEKWEKRQKEIERQKRILDDNWKKKKAEKSKPTASKPSNANKAESKEKKGPIKTKSVLVKTTKFIATKSAKKKKRK